ncbi:SPRY-domain-containing protein [Athelia psychrophila]|uniref:SPRY-domain-containing protein n=1 Tax=Athelia psychrophila TaxID=1759441 RepID=A0A166U3Q6_9AGAM|nr:SPRY-domain-containing protein [Fibularhizoctonia sp. CBS 109695]
MQSATTDGQYVLSQSVAQTLRDILSAAQNDTVDIPENRPNSPPHDALLILLPLLIVLSTFLFMLLFFLVCVILIRRRRGIVLRDHDGPVDMSREDLIEGEGGFEGVESRWMESVSETVQRSYLRAKDFQLQYPPNSQPTDITLSQFLSIQEKGVSAWCFEPDYETLNSLLVHARTEITFLPDPASSSSVQSNLPLPKLNEVYYWEVKMFDLPESTNVAVGLATKPYPVFRLPGLSRHSVAYHSNGDKSHSFPFTASTFGPSLKEGDVLGVGYRPRTGTVFFTRNGRKTEDAFVGLNRWNLFPTIGADGPCSVHVNLGQAGFVFIEANVKKWGLAPSAGTLAPPPAYGSERGSILLDVGGGGASPSGVGSPPVASSPASSRRSHRSRRPKPPGPSSAPLASSPLTGAPLNSLLMSTPSTPPPPITPIDEEPPELAGPSNAQGYISPTDLPFHLPANANLPALPAPEESGSDSEEAPHASPSDSTSPLLLSRSASPGEGEPSGSELTVQVHPPPESPSTPNPPTPNQRDIGLQALTDMLRSTHASRNPSTQSSSSGTDAITRQEPPAYSPLDAYTYADGVHIDLPAEVISAALEGQAIPESAIGQTNNLRSDRRRSRRR